MNGKKAKAIRKEVYGDISLRIKRNYVVLISGEIVNHPASYRAKYQKAKKEVN